MSFGASYIAANNSAQFVVRDVFLHQVIPDDITIKISGSETPIEKKIFEKGEPMGKTEKFSVNTTEDLNVVFEMGGLNILEVKIQGVSDIKEKPEAKINATVP